MENKHINKFKCLNFGFLNDSKVANAMKTKTIKFIKLISGFLKLENKYNWTNTRARVNNERISFLSLLKNCSNRIKKRNIAEDRYIKTSWLVPLTI